MSKIIGATVSTTTPQSDWEQNDPNKADYIKNKPVVEQEYDENSTNAQSGKAVAEAIAGIKDGGGGESGATFIPSVSADGVISWTNDKDLPNPSPVNIKGADGYTPQKEIDYFDGTDGKDGTSVRIDEILQSTEDGEPSFVHFSDGSIMEVYNGNKGSDGYSPVRGKDYWTEADKAEIKGYVDQAILGGEW